MDTYNHIRERAYEVRCWRLDIIIDSVIAVELESGELEWEDDISSLGLAAMAIVLWEVKLKGLASHQKQIRHTYELPND